MSTFEEIIEHAKSAFEQFAPVMNAWGISQDEYFITGRLNLGMLGYRTAVKPSGNDMVYGVRQGKLPWFRGEPRQGFQETPPPLKIHYEETVNQWIRRFHTGIHFYTFSHTQWLRQRNHCDRFVLPQGTPLNLTNLYGAIEGTAENMLPDCTEAGVGLEKGVRMIELITRLRDEARRTHDRPAEERANQALNEFAWISDRYAKVSTESRPTESQNIIAGQSVVPGIVRGPAFVMTSFDSPPPDAPAIIVAERLSPKWYQWKDRMQALVIDHGGQLGHAAILARELKIPTVIQTVVGTKKIRSGDQLEVDAGRGVVTIMSNHL